MFLKHFALAALILCPLDSMFAAAESNEPLRVGATLPLSGDYSFVGSALQRGMELALKDLPPDQIKIWYEDEGVVDRAKAVSGFQKLVSANAVHVVLGSTVNTVTAYAPIATRQKIPVISLWDSNRSIDNLGDYVFSIGFSTEQAGEKMAQFAFETLKASKLAVLSAHDEWSEIISEAFIQKYKALGGAIVLHENIGMLDSDLRTVLTKIKTSPAQAIYAPLYLSSLYAVIRQSKTLGFKGSILVADGMVESDATQLGDTADGVMLTQIWLDSPAFSEKYKKVFAEDGSPVALSLASLGYDAVMMLGQVLARLKADSRPVTAQSVRDALLKVDYTGVSAHINFNGKRSISQVETLVRVKGGKFEKLAP